MTNLSRISTTLNLLGVVEMEKLKYLYSFLAIALYVIIMFICVMIVYVSWTEESLYEPMYIFICNLATNMMLGSSTFFPKLVIDLLSGISTISLSGCLTQAFCIQCFSSVEVSTFSLMAYDRYLAVGHPLRYHSLMTNRMALKFIVALWILVFVIEAVFMTLTTRLTLCGVDISNAFCETMSLLHLACGDITAANVFGTVWALFLIIGTILVSVYCYVGTFIICLNISLEAYQKAIHTLMTHIVAFSFTMSAGVFVIFRYRLNSGSISSVAHVAISVTGLTSALTLNPLIYGIRTEALRIKIIQTLRNSCLHDREQVKNVPSF